MNNWKEITQESDVQNIIEKSVSKPQIIFKHSVTCGISAHAEDRLMNGSLLLTENADFNYLDLLRFRSISRLIAAELKVTHQSPQIIVLKDKKVVYTTSHHAIEPKAIAKHLS
jgi:bacillithiol system protein YtxJ